MSYMLCHANCIGCGKTFTFNPFKVPSIKPTPGAAREPLCFVCASFVREIQIADGKTPAEIAPDAYDAVEVSD